MTQELDQWQVLDKLRGSVRDVGHLFVPQLVSRTMAQLLEGFSAKYICDPGAGIGVLIHTVQEATQASKAFAFTQSSQEADVGQELASRVHWEIGDPLGLITKLEHDFDLFASILPFEVRRFGPVALTTAAGKTISITGALSHVIMLAASQRLSSDGIGLFVVTPSLFLSPSSSILRDIEALGLGIEAVLAFPSGTFAPYTNVLSYLVIIRKRLVLKTFVAQLASEPNTNAQIISNLREGKEGCALGLGRFVDLLSFKGMDSMRTAERFEHAESQFRAPTVSLQELSTAINLGRFGEGFEFPKLDNAVFIPLIGTRDVVTSSDDLTLKRQNYIQVGINSTRSDARFVANFLNSELGREIREWGKTRGVIPKLNTRGVNQLRIHVPDLRTQKEMLEIELRIAVDQNTLRGLQAELAGLRRELWSNPPGLADVDKRQRLLSSRLTAGLKKHSLTGLDTWFETLPFPLASILRAWQATSSQDFKTKYEHLLHFFEATAEFLSVILLSAFSSREPLFEEHKKKLGEVLNKQNLSFRRATFGTWKLVFEYLAKQTRQLLSGDKDLRALCADIFADETLTLPKMLGRKDLAEILAVTNKMRNDWTGHGGVVSQTEAQLRNEQLLGEAHKLRNSMAEDWADIQLIYAIHCRPRRGLFENEIAVLSGSNSEFLKETRSMGSWLDIERLYLTRRDAMRALELLPLVQVGPSPDSAKNACYFFNRVEKDGFRFVSYHFAETPERKEPLEEAPVALKFLGEL